MAITRKNIFDKINFYLKQENKFFTSNEIHLSINDAFRRIAEDIDYPKTNYSTYMTSGQWSVSTPADFLKLDKNSQITYESTSGSYAVLDNKLQTDIGRDNIFTIAPGVPQYYFEESESKIGIHPPSTSGCIVIPYVKAPTDLSSDAATNELTENCYMASVWWVTAECMLKDSDPRAQGFTGLYTGEITRLKRRFGVRQEQSHNFKPHPSY